MEDFIIYACYLMCYTRMETKVRYSPEGLAKSILGRRGAKNGTQLRSLTNVDQRQEVAATPENGKQP